MQYDSTGMFHWCPSRKIDDCLMDRQEAAMTVLQVNIDLVKHQDLSKTDINNPFLSFSTGSPTKSRHRSNTEGRTSQEFLGQDPLLYR